LKVRDPDITCLNETIWIHSLAGCEGKGWTIVPLLPAGARWAGNRPAIESGAVDPAQRPGIRQGQRQTAGVRVASAKQP
jgi:hypothetical protein